MKYYTVHRDLILKGVNYVELYPHPKNPKILYQKEDFGGVACILGVDAFVDIIDAKEKVEELREKFIKNIQNLDFFAHLNH